MNKYTLGKQKTLADLCEKKDKKILALEQWIESEGVVNDTCTYHILGKVCTGCKCPRAIK